ncbi:hypothetical protein Gogos_012094 [Gossypium gossypioides]|uniref:Uncharacterized protein n=1 Tax=Gossypium gossypioides TaxID=34282 RepID=A0A7J9BRG5_GOSGO|nr:hypothetical protein [Gossypium gossypioides]
MQDLVSQSLQKTFSIVPEIEFLYKVCGSSLSGKIEFENRRGRSFNMAKERVKSGSSLVLKKPRKKPKNLAPVLRCSWPLNWEIQKSEEER